MESKSRPLAAPSAVVLLASIVPALALARCGIWPTFPARDGGVMDAGDAGAVTMDVHMDTTQPPVDVRDVPSDMGMDSGGFGFMACSTAPTNGPFDLSVVASVPSGTRDLAFDGRTGFVTATTEILSFDASATSSALPGANLGLSARSLRYLPNGDIATVTTEQALRIYEASTMMVNTVASGFSYLNGLAVDSTGAMFFSDTALSGAMPAVRRATSSGMVAMVTTSVPVPTGLALTPDNRHLFIGSAGRGVYYVDLAADGSAVGTPHMYLNEPVNAYGIAFDECGYLYVSDADRGRILRVPPGGGSYVALNVRAPDAGNITPVGIAFGQMPFDTTSLYFVDLSASVVYRVPVNVRGASVVLPSM
jgi:DNA-binding beta-propeller fold protein YncE